MAMKLNHKAVRKELVKYDMKKKDLSKAIGITSRTLTTLQKQDVDVSIETFMKLCRFLGISDWRILLIEQTAEEAN